MMGWNQPVRVVSRAHPRNDRQHRGHQGRGQRGGRGCTIPGLDTTDFIPHTMESHRSVLSREGMQAVRSKGRSTPGPPSLLTRPP